MKERSKRDKIAQKKMKPRNSKPEKTGRKKVNKEAIIVIRRGSILLILCLIVMGGVLIGKMLGNVSEEKYSDGTEISKEHTSAAGNPNEKFDHTEKENEEGKYNSESENFAGENVPTSREEYVRKQIKNFADTHQLSIHDYPEELIESLVTNEEKEDFVLWYPLKKGSYSKEELTECIGQSGMPLLIQWDDRWGYYPYGNSVIGISGCGPTCLSMVALHLLQDAKYTPIFMADYAMQNDYYADGVGTAWDFMTKGAKKIGLHVQEVGLDEKAVMRHLNQGRPIICAMGPGDFTTTGHFIVLAGVENGKIRIYDCNSRKRSEKLWEFWEFKYQIKNMWAYSVRQ